MPATQWTRSIALLVAGSCFAFASPHWDASHLAHKAPSKVAFQAASLRVFLDEEYFTSNTYASVQYIKNVATLNWIGELKRKIPDTVQIHVNVEKTTKGGKCRKQVYDSHTVPFCHSLSKTAQSYVSLIGFQAANPPVKDCPFEPGIYTLKGYEVDPSTLDDSIERGELTVYYNFTLNGNVFFAYEIHVDVM